MKTPSSSRALAATAAVVVVVVALSASLASAQTDVNMANGGGNSNTPGSATGTNQMWASASNQGGLFFAACVPAFGIQNLILTLFYGCPVSCEVEEHRMYWAMQSCTLYQAYGVVLVTSHLGSFVEYLAMPCVQFGLSGKRGARDAREYDSLDALHAGERARVRAPTNATSRDDERVVDKRIPGGNWPSNTNSLTTCPLTEWLASSEWLANSMTSVHTVAGGSGYATPVGKRQSSSRAAAAAAASKRQSDLNGQMAANSYALGVPSTSVSVHANNYTQLTPEVLDNLSCNYLLNQTAQSIMIQHLSAKRGQQKRGRSPTKRGRSPTKRSQASPSIFDPATMVADGFATPQAPEAPFITATLTTMPSMTLWKVTQETSWQSGNAAFMHTNTALGDLVKFTHCPPFATCHNDLPVSTSVSSRVASAPSNGCTEQCVQPTVSSSTYADYCAEFLTTVDDIAASAFGSTQGAYLNCVNGVDDDDVTDDDSVQTSTETSVFSTTTTQQHSSQQQFELVDEVTPENTPETNDNIIEHINNIVPDNANLITSNKADEAAANDEPVISDDANLYPYHTLELGTARALVNGDAAALHVVHASDVIEPVDRAAVDDTNMPKSIIEHYNTNVDEAKDADLAMAHVDALPRFENTKLLNLLCTSAEQQRDTVQTNIALLERQQTLHDALDTAVARSGHWVAAALSHKAGTAEMNEATVHSCAAAMALHARVNVHAAFGECIAALSDGAGGDGKTTKRTTVTFGDATLAHTKHELNCAEHPVPKLLEGKAATTLSDAEQQGDSAEATKLLGEYRTSEAAAQICSELFCFCTSCIEAHGADAAINIDFGVKQETPITHVVDDAPINASANDSAIDTHADASNDDEPSAREPLFLQMSTSCSRTALGKCTRGSPGNDMSVRYFDRVHAVVDAKTGADMIEHHVTIKQQHIAGADKSVAMQLTWAFLHGDHGAELTSAQPCDGGAALGPLGVNERFADERALATTVGITLPLAVAAGGQFVTCVRTAQSVRVLAAVVGGAAAHECSGALWFQQCESCASAADVAAQALAERHECGVSDDFVSVLTTAWHAHVQPVVEDTSAAAVDAAGVAIEPAYSVTTDGETHVAVLDKANEPLVAIEFNVANYGSEAFDECVLHGLLADTQFYTCDYERSASALPASAFEARRVVAVDTVVNSDFVESAWPNLQSTMHQHVVELHGVAAKEQLNVCLRLPLSAYQQSRAFLHVFCRVAGAAAAGAAADDDDAKSARRDTKSTTTTMTIGTTTKLGGADADVAKNTCIGRWFEVVHALQCDEQIADDEPYIAVFTHASLV